MWWRRLKAIKPSTGSPISGSSTTCGRCSVWAWDAGFIPTSGDHWRGPSPTCTNRFSLRVKPPLVNQLPEGPHYGILAEFATPADLYHACERVRDAGFTRWDAHTPFPVHGLEGAMGLRRSPLPWSLRHPPPVLRWLKTWQDERPC